jgi:hypothetical protein
VSGSYNPCTQPNLATQAGYVPQQYENANPQFGAGNQSVQEWIEQTHGHTQMQTGIGHQDYQDENFQGELRLQQATLYQPPTEAEEIEDEDTEFEHDSKYDAARLLPNAASDQIQSSNPV